MNVIAVHPAEIILEMALDNPSLIYISYPELIKEIILKEKDLTIEDCKKMAIVFGTSNEYWMNMQSQYDLCKKSKGESE